MSGAPPLHVTDAVLRLALAEDLGGSGDITTNAVFDAAHTSTARIVAREPGTIAGLEIALGAFTLLDAGVESKALVPDGAGVAAATPLAELAGPTRALLSAERVCLNLLGHLSGIATATRAVVDAVGDRPTRVVDTRKTTPGLRALEKYAVRCGGGHNHRFGLYDAAMIKDNHIAAAGSVLAAVRAVRSAVGHTVTITVEIDRADQIEDALSGGADVLLLDNMRGEALRSAVELVAGRAVTEASGGVDIDTIADVAAAGVDIVSLGSITHSAPRLDVALDM
jgi:nicotinate-nucleotide pyrophosphorylase (carboxylating)